MYSCSAESHLLHAVTKIFNLNAHLDFSVSHLKESSLFKTLTLRLIAKQPLKSESIVRTNKTVETIMHNITPPFILTQVGGVEC